MTRFIHDQFAKDYLEELLKPYGKVEAQKPVSAEVRYIDIFFSPFTAEIPNLEILGLLGQFASIPAIFEPFRNPADEEEICHCLKKELEIKAVVEREAKRNKTTLLDQEIRINQTIESEDRELIMRLAPLYQQEKERIQQESRQEGRQEGRQEARQELILQLLTYKFGELNSSLIKQIQPLSEEQLEALGKALLDFSEIAQLETWLRNVSQAARDQ